MESSPKVIKSIIVALALGAALLAVAPVSQAVGNDDRDVRNLAAPASPPRMNW